MEPLDSLSQLSTILMKLTKWKDAVIGCPNIENYSDKIFLLYLVYIKSIEKETIEYIMKNNLKYNYSDIIKSQILETGQPFKDLENRIRSSKCLLIEICFINNIDIELLC